MKKLALICLILMLPMASLSFAATCAEQSYSSSCAKCSFDASGKMDKACYDSEQNTGLECLFAAYPVQSGEYKLGMCPGIDVCVQRLTACRDRLSTGDDKADCKAGNVLRCFVQSDLCVEEATSDCSKPPAEQPSIELPSSNELAASPDNAATNESTATEPTVIAAPPIKLKPSICESLLFGGAAPALYVFYSEGKKKRSKDGTA